MGRELAVGQLRDPAGARRYRARRPSRLAVDARRRRTSTSRGPDAPSAATIAAASASAARGAAGAISATNATPSASTGASAAGSQRDRLRASDCAGRARSRSASAWLAACAAPASRTRWTWTRADTPSRRAASVTERATEALVDQVDDRVDPRVGGVPSEDRLEPRASLAGQLELERDPPPVRGAQQQVRVVKPLRHRGPSRPSRTPSGSARRDPTAARRRGSASGARRRSPRAGRTCRHGQPATARRGRRRARRRAASTRGGSRSLPTTLRPGRVIWYMGGRARSTCSERSSRRPSSLARRACAVAGARPGAPPRARAARTGARPGTAAAPGPARSAESCGAGHAESHP